MTQEELDRFSAGERATAALLGLPLLHCIASSYDPLCQVVGSFEDGWAKRALKDTDHGYDLYFCYAFEPHGPTTKDIWNRLKNSVTPTE